MFAGSLEGHFLETGKTFTESKVADNSENGHGYMVTSLMTGECYGTFLTKFLKQVVFLLLGICLTLLCL